MFLSLQDMVRWADEEMDAKERLQSLTNRILEELDALRGQQPARLGSPNGTASAAGTGTGSWKQRKMMKMEKLELSNLQLSLQAEIQAKEKINEDLHRAHAKIADMEA